jgi:hypothetical protein
VIPKTFISFKSILNYNYKQRNVKRLVPDGSIARWVNLDELDDASYANDDVTRYTRKGPGNEGPRNTQGSLENPHS